MNEPETYFIGAGCQSIVSSSMMRSSTRYCLDPGTGALLARHQPALALLAGRRHPSDSYFAFRVRPASDMIGIALVLGGSSERRRRLR
jgi:hypothetical protein